MLELIVLGSGSHGNATLIRSQRSAILIDVGFSTRELCRRLEAVEQAPERIDALLLTHEHGDHIAGLQTWRRRFATPVYATAPTVSACHKHLQGQGEVFTFETGRPFEAGDYRVMAFPIPHDAADPVGFVVEFEGTRIGHCTDLGHVTHLVQERLTGCAALVFEANHDRQMLIEGPYPWPTKQRVASRFGHLSNDHAAAALPTLAHDSEHVMLAHLSEVNNDPELARATVGSALRSAGSRARLELAPQNRPAPAIRL